MKPGAVREAIPLLVVALTTLLPVSSSQAGAVADYPEFPYPATTYTEPYRGQFHFSSRGGWINDVNAPLYYKGTYHLFFQHNPHGLAWDTMHWGHATSPDLVHWTQKPMALEPGVHPGDLWSGAGVVDTNNTSGLRTGSDAPFVVFAGTQGVIIHYSNDQGRTFQTYDGGRKVVVPSGSESRDPKVFWHAATSRWVMVVWSNGGGNGVNIYTSTNLLDWTYRSRYSADWLFECPDFFALAVDGNTANTQWVMTDASGEYVLGAFDGATFTPAWSTPQRMDMGTNNPGGSFYAGLVFHNMPDGRTVQMAWMPNSANEMGNVWTSSLSFPAELKLKTFPEGVRLTRYPITEIESLRTSSASWTNRTITTDAATDPLAGTSADTYELFAEFDLTGATASRFGFKLHARADGTADRLVTYERGAQTLYGFPLAPINNRIKMRVLVDRSQLEVFGNDGKLSVTDKVKFNSAAASQGIRLYAEGGSVKLVSLQLYRLGSAWGTGESTLDSNLTGSFTSVGGTWTDVTGGKQGAAGPGANAFYLSPRTGTDFTYEADVRVVNGVAAALTFRANADATQHYTLNVDTSGVVKLWRPGRDIATYATPILAGRTYHLKVAAQGSRFLVYLNNGTTPIIDASDTSYASGRFGFNVYDGTGLVQNAYVDGTGFRTNLAGPWTAVAGTWTEPLGGKQGAVPGDGFLLSAQTGSNFTYEADVRVVNGVAAALTFRANADATQHYTLNVDTSGVVKLWRPGRDIATYATPILAGRTYHLKVAAQGSRFLVYLNNGTTPIIDASDTSYASGRFGLNAYNAVALIQNVTVSP
ncbi:glycoside hydrolase family 32 protein [Stigmatella sp. ncwal1]|uniref:Glycoside hydrolase family 32 protein n=1 Tax=Stigmatella ashevillensis TaxID=2995309 RepID=A0ABT5DFY9_9BACT|nr:glycoside hydrolase family 32 protein [Stigmatella ashevillena]MDC0712586.1 glycoside hydrolase family 32 protein [Stigmatella ashevillena]